jgi:transcriptional repressor NrdR
MRCPFCGHDDTQVKDSRPTEDNSSIRRRRFCPACGARFTTFERIQLRELVVVKKDGAREPFEREKVLRSMHIALRKREVDADRIERIVNSLVRQLESSGETDIASKTVGEMVMKALETLDKVAYVRYASVYKDFQEPGEFSQFVDRLRDVM